MKVAWRSDRSAQHTRWAIAILFVAFNACGFPYAAFGCLLGAAVVSATSVHQL